MPLIIFHEWNGTTHEVDVAAGTSVKQAALDNAVPGILGDCGGNVTCGTCHGYVAPEYLDRLEPKSEDETLILEGVPAPLEENSRLTCQLVMTGELDGISVRLPETQV